MIEVSEYRAGDFEAVLRLWWDAWHAIAPGLRHPSPFEAWRTRWVEEILPAQRVAVAREAAQILGFAAVDVANQELTQIFVAPGLQRRGVGTSLLGWAQAVLPGGFRLSTLLENEPSRAFYRRHGLIEGGTHVSAVNGRPAIEYRWPPPAPA